MKIGELARHAEINIQTLRFYERKGLLKPPIRTVSGYRSYQPSDLARVRFIRSCQTLGFTLREIRELISLHGSFSASQNGNQSTAKGILQLAGDRLAMLDEKIRALTAMRDELTLLVAGYNESRPTLCPASR